MELKIFASKSNHFYNFCGWFLNIKFEWKYKFNPQKFKLFIIQNEL